MKRAHLEPGFIRSVQLLRERVAGFSRYPFSIPAVRALEELALHPKVPFAAAPANVSVSLAGS